MSLSLLCYMLSIASNLILLHFFGFSVYKVMAKDISSLEKQKKLNELHNQQLINSSSSSMQLFYAVLTFGGIFFASLGIILLLATIIMEL